MEAKFEELYKGWFGSKLSIGAMKRGSINEESVMMTLRRNDFIFGVYEVGLILMKEAPFFAFSPDGIVLLSIESVPFDDFCGADCTLNVINYCLESLEIKTRVTPRTSGHSIEHVYFDPIYFYVGDDVFHKHVPIKKLLRSCIKL